MMDNPLAKKLSNRSPLSGEEEEVLTQAVSRVLDVSADEDIVQEGSQPHESTLLLSGFAARYKHVPNGKRQIVAIHVAGDFVDLHSFLIKKMDHGVFAMSRCRLAMVPHNRLRDITERFPHLTRLLWLNTLIDAAIHREWLVGMGRRSAFANVSHLLCELFLRLSAVDQTDGFRFRLPLTQEELADTLGLSIVHLNRALRSLRERQVVAWQGAEVVIRDWDRLVELGEFDPTYLQLEVRGR